MTPLPTPYDISDIPRFAYVPGLLEWALLLLGTAAAWLLVRRPPRAPAVEPGEAPISETIRALRALFERVRGAENEKELLFRVSTLVKRYLESLFGAAISGMTAPELKKFADGRDDRRLAQVAGILSELEHRSFAPRRSGAIPPELGENLMQSLADLDAAGRLGTAERGR